ncbi:BREX-1 system phosphatase PglZ type A [Tsukamurella spumae]|uniref:BREX-1 system phosphatase PglZ type A n=1 Tax=Tsukamurella spumae TaxID=44753 RepID=A0A846WXW0_9ACTN|nr:BREX-1 system phosphatase PglZ type A [Tsukamurella spumae]NKY16939.1 BREX-1 system phosphatase PglZ type A [Tsukamurella spumae]
MTAAPSNRIAELLAERFAASPVVTWGDVPGEYAASLDEIAGVLGVGVYDVVVHRVEGNELGIKTRVYADLDDPARDKRRRHLVYRTGERPARPDNWLLDLEAGYGLFTADTAAILVHELGLTDRGIDHLVKRHSSAFAVAGRAEAIRRRLEAADPTLSSEKLAETVLAFLSAEVLGLEGKDSHRLQEIVTALFVDYADEEETGYQALADADLIDFLWSGCADIYGYRTDSPSVAGLVTWMFDQAWQHWPDARNPARIDFERLRDGRQYDQLFRHLARTAERDLNIADRLRGADHALDQLAATNVFPVVDEAVIGRLAAAIHRRELAPDAVREILAKRRTTTWFIDQQTSYAALEAAAECLTRIEAFLPVMADATDGVRSYASSWAPIDGAYRRFRNYFATAETELPTELADKVEKQYLLKYQRPLAAAWQEQVDALTEWAVPGVEPLRGFAAHDLPAKAKTLVVISDAFRYEVGLELAQRMNRENDWFDATVEPRLAPLPSLTFAGMAAMLPHSKLSLHGESVRADGASTSGRPARNALWAKVHATAIDFDEVMSMSPADRNALWQSNDALVVYHDTIDKAGHKAPHQVPDACATAVGDLLRIIKSFGSGKMRASRVLVTADHGFLYQRSNLEPTEYLSEKPQGEVVAFGRRHVIGEGLKEQAAFRTWTPQALGYDSGDELQVPRGLHRLSKQGQGVQYVHGGASLQEVVVPLVTLTRGRNATVSKVRVDVNVSTPTITTSTVMVTLLQRDPVQGKTRGRELVIGVYAPDGVLLSGERTVEVASEAPDIRDRGRTVELVLNEEAGRYNGQVITIRAEERINGQTTPYQSTTATLQRSFGGFNDAF